jgi:hypothetical protein
MSKKNILVLKSDCITACNLHSRCLLKGKTKIASTDMNITAFIALKIKNVNIFKFGAFF